MRHHTPFLIRSCASWLLKRTGIVCEGLRPLRPLLSLLLVQTFPEDVGAACCFSAMGSALSLPTKAGVVGGASVTLLVGLLI